MKTFKTYIQALLIWWDN